MNATLETALDLCRRGLNPLPLRSDKRPAFHLLELIRGTNAWGTIRDAPLDDAELRQAWKVDPEAWLGSILPPEHVVLDVDDLDSGDVPDVPKTWTKKTPRGVHFHLHTDKPIRHAKLGCGDLLCAGDISVMPATPGYRWTIGPDEAELAELPESLVRIAREPQVVEGALVSWVYVSWANSMHRDTQEDVSLRLLAALGGPENASLGHNFRCVLHDDRHASAELYRLRDGTIAYHCFGPCGWMSLPLVHARQSGRQGRIGRVETMLWRLSLLERAGLVEGVELAAPEVSFPLTNIWRGFLRLLSLRWLTTPRSPTPFSRRFGAAWCGVSEAEIRVGFPELRQLGFVVYAGRDPRGLALWLPCEEVVPLAD